MPVKYELADDTAEKLLGQVLKHKFDGSQPHRNLIGSKARIDLEFAIGKDGSPSVKVGGYESFGKVKIFPPEDRELGAPDFRLIVDKFKWEKATTEQRQGIIDHLLQQIDVRTDKKGEFITDTAGRPKLKHRKYDMRLAGFSDVVKRNGDAAPEAQAAKELKDSFGQLLMWAEDPRAAA